MYATAYPSSTIWLKERNFLIIQTRYIIGKPGRVSNLITEASIILSHVTLNNVANQILETFTEIYQKILFFAEVISKKLDFSGTFSRKTAK